MKNQRSYTLLEEYNVQPSIHYMTQIRNVDGKIADDKNQYGPGEPKNENHHEQKAHESAHS
jgi:hypothetical protein